VIWFNSADRVAVLGEVERDGCRCVIGFEPADFGVADSAEFLERQSASAAVGREIGREWRDAFEEGLGACIEIALRLLGLCHLQLNRRPARGVPLGVSN